MASEKGSFFLTLFVGFNICLLQNVYAQGATEPPLEGGKPNEVPFESESLINKMTDFVFDPIENTIEIIMNAMNRTRDAIGETMSEINHDLGSLVLQVQSVFSNPAQALNVTTHVASGGAKFAGHIASRFGNVATGLLNESAVGIGETVDEGRIVLDSLIHTGFNASLDVVKEGANATLGVVDQIGENIEQDIFENCLWYEVGISNSCIPFRLWKAIEDPIKLAIHLGEDAIIVPIKLALDTILLPITAPIMAVTLPIKLALGAVSVGEEVAVDAGKGAVVGAKLGVEGAEAAVPVVASGGEAVLGYVGQFGARIVYHFKRIAGLIF